jgi:hypothetical protein
VSKVDHNTLKARQELDGNAPGAANPPVRANNVPATIPTDPILTPRTIDSVVKPEFLSLFFSTM